MIFPFPAAAFCGSPPELEYCIPPMMIPMMAAMPAIADNSLTVGLIYFANRHSLAELLAPGGQHTLSSPDIVVQPAPAFEQSTAPAASATAGTISRPRDTRVLASNSLSLVFIFYNYIVISSLAQACLHTPVLMLTGLPVYSKVKVLFGTQVMH